MRVCLASLAALSLALAFCPARAEDGRPAEPNSYRMQDFRAPTPATLSGAQVLTTGKAEEHWRKGKAVFIDVLPQPQRPANLPEGTLWRDKPRPGIPGSLWLPDTGYGALNPAMEDYFRVNLERAAGADRNKTLVFYCLKDCCMSWNAAKRALSLGYPHVAWYPDGTDGWTALGLPVELIKPVPRPQS
jgi:PQQ-dependent catabolism-associated CXXCW motif protein